MKYFPVILCGISIIVGWNALAILRDQGKTIDIEYRTVHKLFCIKNPNHHHCK